MFAQISCFAYNRLDRKCLALIIEAVGERLDGFLDVWCGLTVYSIVELKKRQPHTLNIW
jgi:hypothetical protein